MKHDLIVDWDDPVDGENYAGQLVNSTWCPVTNRWVLLVACMYDSTFKTVYSDQLSVQVFPGMAVKMDDDSGT